MALASSSPTAAAAGGPPSTLPPGAVLRRSPVGNVSKPVPVFTFGEEGYPVFREPVAAAVGAPPGVHRGWAEPPRQQVRNESSLLNFPNEFTRHTWEKVVKTEQKVGRLATMAPTTRTPTAMWSRRRALTVGGSIQLRQPFISNSTFAMSISSCGILTLVSRLFRYRGRHLEQALRRAEELVAAGCCVGLCSQASCPQPQRCTALPR